MSCDITNTGEYDGDTVAQLYIRDDISSTITFKLMLRGFERIHLKKGETKTVTFTVSPQKSLWLLDEKFNRVVEPGLFKLFIGDSSHFPHKDIMNDQKKYGAAIRLNTTIDLIAE